MNEALRERQAALGAQFGEVGGCAVARHFGDSLREYRAVRDGAGVAYRSDLALLRMWGKDPARMLHGLITNDLVGAPAGQGVYAAMLTPKGRTIAELRAFRVERDGGTEVWINLPCEALPGTREHLKKFVPPMFSRWSDASDERGTVGVYGPRAATLVGHLFRQDLSALAEDGFLQAEFGGGDCLVVRTLAAGGEDGYDLFAPRDLLTQLWDALLGGAPGVEPEPIGFDALNTLRIEMGRPRYGAELTDETIPTEAFEPAGLMQRAISFHKGCYTGQEVIVRIAHRGHVNRLLRGLLLGGQPKPASQTPLLHPETGKQIGWTTSATVSPLLDQTIALGFVRRELGPGDQLRIGDTSGPLVTLSGLPFQP